MKKLKEKKITMEERLDHLEATLAKTSSLPASSMAMFCSSHFSSSYLYVLFTLDATT
jgi:hypothetical protein